MGFTPDYAVRYTHNSAVLPVREIPDACKDRASPIKVSTNWAIPGSLPFMDAGKRVKFNLIDKIEQLNEQRIVAVKHVSLAEEYLADHFPTFPVLPGVMMLECVTQAAGWLLHHRCGFAKSFAVLKEARNVKYGTFVAPGNFLRVDVEWIKDTEAGATFKAIGTVNDATALQARIELAYFNLGDRQPELSALDSRLIEHNRRRWDLIRPSATTETTPALVPGG